VNRLALGGCTAVTLSGYLQALGLLRVLACQEDPGTHLHWERHTAVLTTTLTAGQLGAWLTDGYAPSPVISPWNAGSGFAGNGKSPAAEQVLQDFREASHPRFRALREAIEAGDQVVARGRALGWGGGTFWAEDHKPGVIRLCRAAFPDDALPWLDAAVTLTSNDLQFSPLAGTGGNLGRQDLSATFVQRLALVVGPAAGKTRSLAWAQSALFGGEDVPYVREAVGQYDPGRAGGILSSPGEKADDAGFANPWSSILALEGTLLFASAVTRRLGAAADNGAMPFLTRATAAGHASAASGEKVKGEQWVPLWPRPASLPEVEHLIGEGRAQWRGRQARTSLEFTMAAAALGVDRGVSAFRRFVIAQRLGQNPLAVDAGCVTVRRHPEERLLREPYDWIRRLRAGWLPAGIASGARLVEAEMFAAMAGGGPQSLRRFVIEFGRLHASVARSGAVRKRVSPFAARRAADWLAALPDDPELWVAAGFASLRDPQPAGEGLSTRVLLERIRERQVPGQRPQLEWAPSALTGLDLHGATLARALAEAHRRRVIAARRPAEPGTLPQDLPAVGLRTAYLAGLTLPAALVGSYALGWLDDALIAEYLNGLLALGCRTTTDAAWAEAWQGQAASHPLLAALMPFYATGPMSVQPLGRAGQDPPPPHEVNLLPAPAWAGRLIASHLDGVAADALLRLRLAGCPPVMTPTDLTVMRVDGTRLAGALLLRVPSRTRTHALTSTCAVTLSRPNAPIPEGVLA
jgi:CRISPR-associated protein Csx17